MNSSVREAILDALGGATLSASELAARCNLPAAQLRAPLEALCAEGRIVLTRKKRYALPQTVGLIPARASAQRNGAPLACPLDGAPAMRMRERGGERALPDDLIFVRLYGAEECELAQVVARAHAQLPAYLRIETRRGRRGAARTAVTGVPCDRRIRHLVEVDDAGGAHSDDIALLAIDRYPERGEPMRAHVVRLLGAKSDMRARLAAIAESHDFPTAFPDGARRQAERLSERRDLDCAGREDLRGLLLFTIDGPFSKDFDDAVSLERLADGAWRLGVHIADVSHYVRPGSPIDREARERGTSLYLPGLTVPMLPEALSNDLCSLQPDADRLAMSALMVVREGRIVDHRLVRSVIRSRARLTYDDVNRLFDGESDAVDSSLRETLLDMRALAHALRQRRAAAGAIDLDLPESEFTLDEANVPTDVFPAPRGDAERLIEEFMLAANATVAALARDTGTPLIYRVHEKPDPDRVRALSAFLAGLGLNVRLGGAAHPGLLQDVIERTRDLPAAGAVARMVLRSMQRARYADQPLGHYALAMRDYCHFTSPIRRYPDLTVHRMLGRLIDGAPTAALAGGMAALADQCSAREQEAALAEREADDLMKARYMADRVGESFEGAISNVVDWGFYVMLDNGVEGLVYVASLAGRFSFDPDHCRLVCASPRRIYALGDRVRVRVERADVERMEIDFALCEGESPSAADRLSPPS